MTDPIRFHLLRTLGRRSPEHARAVLDGTAEPIAGAAIERGSAVHALVLGGAKVTFFPGAARRGKEWEQFERDNEGAIILPRGEYDKTQRMADAVRACREARPLLDGTREQTVVWRESGQACRATPDAFQADNVTELKTCREADPRWFGREAIRRDYHAQLAWYTDGLLAAGLARPRSAHIVAVESSAPYPVVVFRLTDDAIEMGRRSCRLWFERLRVCQDTGEWPGYAQGVVDLDVPDMDGDVELTFGDEP